MRPHDRRRPDDQFAVRRQDIEQIDPIAKPVAINRHRRRGHDPQPIAQVRLVLVRRRGHPHLEHGFRHRFGVTELGFVLDAQEHDCSAVDGHRQYGQVKKYDRWISSPTRQAGGLDAVEEREQPALEDLADVDIAQLAVEPARAGARPRWHIHRRRRRRSPGATRGSGRRKSGRRAGKSGFRTRKRITPTGSTRSRSTRR